jgi:hypothetical protein
MLGKHFRPWGNLSWALNKIHNNKWDVFGCLSTEDRCLGVFEVLNANKMLGNYKFLRINDPSSIYSQRSEELIKERTDDYISKGGDSTKIEQHELFEKIDSLKIGVDSFLGHSSGNIILDVSSLPKRFFFPILRLLLNSRDKVKNLIATYAVPERYHDGPLAEDPEPWAHIPLFGPGGYPDQEFEVLIVGVGFLPFGLPELLKSEYRNLSVKLFFPFPPGPPTYQRTWNFVREIAKDFPIDNEMLMRVDTYNVSDAFDYICSITTGNSKKAIMAPYGPKTISIAMCIYATLASAPVYYMQPKIYNPEYSSGIKKNTQGDPEIYAYCLRLDGQDYYKV